MCLLVAKSNSLATTHETEKPSENIVSRDTRVSTAPRQTDKNGAMTRDHRDFTMAASENDDDDDAHQIQQDRTLALELQVEENIGFATAQRQQVTEEHATFDAASFATTETEAALRDERAQFRAANQEAHLRDDIYGEISSASAVAGVSSLAS